MKQEILTLEQGQVADMLLSLKNSHRRINRFLQEYTPPLNGDRYLTDKEVAEVLKVSLSDKHFLCPRLPKVAERDSDKRKG